MQSGTAPISPRPPVGAVSIEGGLDSVTGSLEDLVSTFDEKLTMCFADYQEQVDKIAPVQVCILLLLARFVDALVVTLRDLKCLGSETF